MWYFGMRILGLDLGYLPGDLGDSRFINYLLEHNYQWLTGNADSFWDAGFMYPYKNTIAISDNMLGTGPIYALWRMVGFAQETAFQFWWLTICALNYWGTYFVIKKWFNRTDLAIVVAYVFAFTIYNMYQLNYMQMTIRFMIPFTIYAAMRLVDTGSVKYLFYVALGFLVQLFSVIYTGFFLIYFTVGFVLIYALVTKQFTFITNLLSKKNRQPSLGIFFGSVFILLVLMLPYLHTGKELGFKLFDEVKWNLPVWNGLFLPHPSSTPWSFMFKMVIPENTVWWLQSVFAGGLPLLLTISIPFLWVYWKVKKVKVSALMLTLSIVIFGITLLFIRLDNGLTFYMFIFKLPGMNSMRVMNRFMHVQLFFILIFLILFFKNKSTTWVMALFVLLFIDNSFNPELVRRTPKSEIIQRRTELIEQVNSLKQPHHKSFVVINPTDENYTTHIDAMMASLYCDLPTINGYTSNCPGDFGVFFTSVNQEGFEHWIKVSNIPLSEVLVIKE